MKIFFVDLWEKVNDDYMRIRREYYEEKDIKAAIKSVELHCYYAVNPLGVITELDVDEKKMPEFVKMTDPCKIYCKNLKTFYERQNIIYQTKIVRGRRYHKEKRHFVYSV